MHYQYKTNFISQDTIFPLAYKSFFSLSKGFYLQNILDDSLDYTVRTSDSDVFNIYSIPKRSDDISLLKDLKHFGHLSQIKLYRSIKDVQFYFYTFEVDGIKWNGYASLSGADDCLIYTYESQTKKGDRLRKGYSRFLDRLIVK